MDIKKQIGACLLKGRLAAGISQEALAKMIGVWPTVYARYERGEREPPLSVIIRIAQALNIPLFELLKDLK